MGALVQTSGKTLYLNDTTEKIKDRLMDVAKNFFNIGYWLWEVKQYEYYKENGYADVVEYAEKELGFKKSTTYNFINLMLRYSVKGENGYPKMFIEDKYRKYSISQLQEMLSIKVQAPEQLITPDMTVKEIRQVKKQISDNVISIVKEPDVNVEETISSIDIIEFKNENVECINKEKITVVDIRDYIIKLLAGCTACNGPTMGKIQVLEKILKFIDERISE